MGLGDEVGRIWGVLREIYEVLEDGSRINLVQVIESATENEDSLYFANTQVLNHPQL